MAGPSWVRCLPRPTAMAGKGKSTLIGQPGSFSYLCEVGLCAVIDSLTRTTCSDGRMVSQRIVRFFEEKKRDIGRGDKESIRLGILKSLTSIVKETVRPVEIRDKENV